MSVLLALLFVLIKEMPWRKRKRDRERYREKEKEEEKNHKAITNVTKVDLKYEK